MLSVNWLHWIQDNGIHMDWNTIAHDTTEYNSNWGPFNAHQPTYIITPSLYIYRKCTILINMIFPQLHNATILCWRGKRLKLYDCECVLTNNNHVMWNVNNHVNGLSRWMLCEQMINQVTNKISFAIWFGLFFITHMKRCAEW